MDIESFQAVENLALALPVSETVRQRILFHQPLRVAMQYISNHTKSPVRLKAVAAAVNMEPTSFCKYFRRKTGIGFCGFVRIVKITFAQQLLVQSDQSVAIVASELGYGSSTTFVRNFKRWTGFTPTAFRRHTFAGREAVSRAL
jgi:AraC-like DNA-binding protein